MCPTTSTTSKRSFETENGIVAFNSCSHAGLQAIVAEVRAAFPQAPLRAIVGGLHLFMTPAEEVRAQAKELRDLGIQTIVTGHCTGDETIAILREELAGTTDVQTLESGLVINFS